MEGDRKQKLTVQIDSHSDMLGKCVIWFAFKCMMNKYEIFDGANWFSMFALQYEMDGCDNGYRCIDIL